MILQKQLATIIHKSIFFLLSINYYLIINWIKKN